MSEKERLDDYLAKATTTATTTTPEHVLLYIPNLIGYGRVVLAWTSFCIMLTILDDHDDSKKNTVTNRSRNFLWKLAIGMYICGFVGDLFDGIAARKYNQCSTFGSVLDMITDRCATCGLLFVLACQNITAFGSLYKIGFLFLLILDISSHWVQMYSTIAIGSIQQHHKSIDGNKDKNIIVQWYYKYYWFFGYLCVGAELTYVLLYAKLQFEYEQQQQQSISQFWLLVYRFSVALLIVCIPGMIAKQIVNVAQLLSSCYAIAKYDAIKASSKTN